MKKIIKIIGISIIFFVLALFLLFFLTKKIFAAESCDIQTTFIEQSGDKYIYRMTVIFPSIPKGTFKIASGSKVFFSREVENSRSVIAIVEVNPNDVIDYGWSVVIENVVNDMYSYPYICNALFEKPTNTNCSEFGTGLDCDYSYVEGASICEANNTIMFCCPSEQIFNSDKTSCISKDSLPKPEEEKEGEGEGKAPNTNNEGFGDIDITAGGPSDSVFNALNPLKKFSTIDAFSDKVTPASIISRALIFLFPISGMILFLMIVWGGFEMLSTSATKKSMDAGRQRITAALVGFFLLFASYWIMQIIEVVFGIKVL